MNHKLRINIFARNRIIRFLSVGLLNTIFGYTVYALLIYVRVPYLIALLISTVAGVIFNYFSFGRLVFHGHRGRHVFIRFIITYVITYIANATILYVLNKQFLFNPYVGQIVCIPMSVLLSWLLMHKWVFKKGLNSEG